MATFHFRDGGCGRALGGPAGRPVRDDGAISFVISRRGAPPARRGEEARAASPTGHARSIAFSRSRTRLRRPPPLATLLSQTVELFSLTYGTIVAQVRREPKNASSSSWLSSWLSSSSSSNPVSDPSPAQLLKDFEDPVEVNTQLKRM